MSQDRRPVEIIGGEHLSDEQENKAMARTLRFAELSGFCIEEVLVAFQNLSKALPKANKAAKVLFNTMKKNRETLDFLIDVKRVDADIKKKLDNNFIQNKINKNKPRWQR